jgi:uncharacterized protein YbjT (DUF2867 family)
VPERSGRVVVTGAAGLVGQNLVLMLREAGCGPVVAIDRNEANLALLARLNPGVTAIHADLAEPGEWTRAFDGADAALVLHAQITAKTAAAFERNNLQASARVFDAIAAAGVPYTVLVSSSVVNSAAEDDYTRTKRAQEAMFRERGLPGCVLRPTLMFGWFDPKHFGWLARFMARAPLFPIPGHGRYARQPLYERDFCRVVMRCLAERPAGATYDITGAEHIDYIDIIRAIRAAKGLRTPLVHLPVPMFAALMGAYGWFTAHPPFTTSQLHALMAGDDFSGVDLEATFSVRPTPFAKAIRETFCDPRYAGLAVAPVD